MPVFVFICNKGKHDHLSPSFEALGWLRLHERRYIHSLVLLYHIANAQQQPTSLLDFNYYLPTMTSAPAHDMTLSYQCFPIEQLYSIGTRETPKTDPWTKYFIKAQLYKS